jgi:hypothetical protein
VFPKLFLLEVEVEKDRVKMGPTWPGFGFLALADVWMLPARPAPGAVLATHEEPNAWPEPLAKLLHEKLPMTVVQRPVFGMVVKVKSFVVIRQGDKAIVLVERALMVGPDCPLARTFETAADTLATRNLHRPVDISDHR